MELKINKFALKFKEELPPINRSTHSANRQLIKNQKELNTQRELCNKIDPLVLASQYEKEINQIKINHNQILEELHNELEILRSRNRDLLDELIVMNGGNYCCTHLENLSHEILKCNPKDNHKQLNDILYNAKIQQKSIENNKINCKKELPELITFRNKFVNKDIDKSNLILQDQLINCHKLIDALQQENIQQKAKLNSLTSLLNNGLNISGVGLDNGLIRKNLKSSKKYLSSMSHPSISYVDIVSSKESLKSASGNQ